MSVQLCNCATVQLCIFQSPTCCDSWHWGRQRVLLALRLDDDQAPGGGEADLGGEEGLHGQAGGGLGLHHTGRFKTFRQLGIWINISNCYFVVEIVLYLAASSRRKFYTFKKGVRMKVCFISTCSKLLMRKSFTARFASAMCMWPT